jgi:GntR family transcriptional repressor for pyruvate dehydrogenase complex
VASIKAGDGTKHRKQRLVQETVTKLRELILAQPPETQIGSLTEVAQMLDVGIVTVQQAARILEHEGLLAVRRGPGGGYYGTRPDEAALERMLAAYMRVHGFGYREALEMLSFLDCEIIPAAARCNDASLREAMQALYQRIDQCNTPETRIELEQELRSVLFRMVNRPLIEFLSRATTHQYAGPPSTRLFSGESASNESFKPSCNRMKTWRALKPSAIDSRCY